MNIHERIKYIDTLIHAWEHADASERSHIEAEVGHMNGSLRQQFLDGVRKIDPEADPAFLHECYICGSPIPDALGGVRSFCSMGCHREYAGVD